MLQEHDIIEKRINQKKNCLNLLEGIGAHLSITENWKD